MPTCFAKGELSLTFLEEDACSAVSHDTLLHSESLLVVSARNLEHVAVVVLAHDFTANFLSHSAFEEGTTVQCEKYQVRTNATIAIEG